MSRLFLYLFLIVIVDPYKGLNYRAINIYHISENVSYEIETVGPEEEEKEESLNSTQYIWCNICFPPQYISYTP